MEKSQKLTICRERFSQEVFRLGDKGQAEAYRIAYPSSRKWKDSAVWSAASRLMADSKVAARVAQLQENVARKTGVTAAKIIDEYRKLAFTDLPGIVNFRGGTMTVEDFASLTPDQRACIQSFEVKTETEMQPDQETGKMMPVSVQYVKVKLYSKQAALDKLADFMALGKLRTIDPESGDLIESAGSDDDDGAPVYIGFQQNVQINVQQ